MTNLNERWPNSTRSRLSKRGENQVPDDGPYVGNPGHHDLLLRTISPNPLKTAMIGSDYLAARPMGERSCRYHDIYTEIGIDWAQEAPRPRRRLADLAERLAGRLRRGD